MTKEQLDALRGHTPGPWSNVDYALSNEIRTLSNPLIAIVQSRYCGSPEKLRSNAALIAAAPDLLAHINKQQAEIDKLRQHAEAMRDALEWYEEKVGDCNRTIGPGDSARAALAQDIGRRATSALDAYRAAYPRTD